MLKRLELVGFKSFADKTAFDFPPGIAAVVGPNGSGKSNVVDAIRWVLGEQSARSLRGGEMTDVIFNGSTARRSLGLAEVTLTFDNSRGTLATTDSEVQVTRRVYRDGEGEYLINGRPSRLKDLKDLFLGSGAGTGTYCIIEQGRVDALLQASKDDRRAIFEEAAGISRFKAKKQEALRKLEKVEQNLERVRDVLGEVDGQLRAVRLQAAKAERFRDYTARARELRVWLGLGEYRELSARLAELDARLGGLRDELGRASSESSARAEESRTLTEELARLDAELRDRDGRWTQARERVSGLADALHRGRSQLTAVIEELDRDRSRRSETAKQVRALATAFAGAAAEATAAELAGREKRHAVDSLAASAKELDRDRADCQSRLERAKADHLERLREAARRQNDAVSARAHLDQLLRERDRLSRKSAQAAEQLSSLDLELQVLTVAEGDIQARSAAARESQSARERQRSAIGRQVEQGRDRLADLRATESGLASRIDVLENLERSQEGLNAGLREVLAELAAGGPLTGAVAGFVPDLLAVPHERAALIDLALGPASQAFVSTDFHALTRLLAGREPFGGRVTFLDVHGDTALSPMPDEPGAERADRWARCDVPGLADLPARLLGRTFFVPDLDAARVLARQRPGVRVVTLAGELLEPDGTLTTGTHRAEVGVLSRKSELREARQRRDELRHHVVTAEREQAARVELADTLDRQIRAAARELEVLAEQAADLKRRSDRHRQKRDGLSEEVAQHADELHGLDREIARLQREWAEANQLAEAAEKAAARLQAEIEAGERAAQQREQERQRRQQELTAARVELAQAEERLTAAVRWRDQAAADLASRRDELTSLDFQMEQTAARRQAVELQLLRDGADLAGSLAVAETAAAQRDELARQHEARSRRYAEVRAELDAARTSTQERREQLHRGELEAGELSHRRTALVQRLREDHAIDLEQLAAEPPPEPPALDGRTLNADTARDEIDELKRKLARLGSVNLESLHELAEAERRSTELHAQHDDLVSAEKSLREILDAINADSRRLFSETYATVRGHFRDLFRRLFGGGLADVVLENEADVLESGIEIVARPPGKELRSIALMSGGERTLTAVALLLAIFRSKPSPFCVLDEVDAALDEANTDRLTSAIRDFAGQSQFILVTHDKRMMAIADVLYGVTMQEPGVSKKVAVRLEDWPAEERKAA